MTATTTTEDPTTPDASDASTFDVNEFLNRLDAVFASHSAATKAEPLLLDAMTDAENAGDFAGLLTVLNETMGFYRSQGRHQDNQWIIQRAIELALRLGLEGTEAWTTTLINAATSQRAAGNMEQAEDLYEQALASARTTLAPTDRRLAALHNNYSMLLSETDRPAKARAELEEALHILESSSPDPTQDVDIASTCTNLALLTLQNGSGGEQALSEARTLADRALAIYRDAHAEHSAHFASALAGAAQVSFAAGDAVAAVRDYERALAIIAECYGEHTEYYAVTAQNLAEARAALVAQDAPASASTATEPQPAPQQRAEPATHTAPTNGMQLARDYWLAYGKPMLAERYAEFAPRIAVGLVGHGSECYGFDDALSHDHDSGPRFCMWLTADDYARIGEQLQADYESLPAQFHGFARTAATPRTQGAGRRSGVFEIGEFFTSITGYPTAPGEDEPHLWMMLDEATLAAATNGRVFADALGAFSKTRQSFKLMPDDVRLALVSKRLGMIAQAGQYNLPRMLQRGDGAAAWLCISEFANAVSSLVFLINNPVTVGYAPYYKWRFAALRALSARAGMRLTGVCAQLEQVLRLASAACFGGAGFGEGGAGAAPNVREVQRIVDGICAQIVQALQELGLTTSGEDFLEWQRPYVEAHIVSDAACLHSL
ncbi:DUF4037 domain-containing protein [Bifidobacterium pseudolongum]|uniref:Tetratricopeptide repeats containing protein n=1 Tax=Bifidobacterium pseudolongum subsp. globosum TaxID=1690 RepID=A0A2N3R7E4_9BIFI|nr:DUF4037 domain-containing protein [Bifidobacterium pseudolongum]PKV05264.1 Tetratricopeptide repeats containing protein [Bifidobacterium pseudolongum subsp. globosum]